MVGNIDKSNEILSRFARFSEQFKINEACECLSGEVCAAIDDLSITIADAIDRENDDGTPLNSDGQIQRQWKSVIEKIVQAVIEFKVLGKEHKQDAIEFIDVTDSVLVEILEAVHDLSLIKTLSETLSYYTGQQNFQSFLLEKYYEWGEDEYSEPPEPQTRSRLRTLGFDDDAEPPSQEYSVEGDRDSVEIRTNDADGFGLRREVTEAPGLGMTRPRLTQQWPTKKTDIGLGDELRGAIAEREAERMVIPANPIPDLKDTELADLEKEMGKQIQSDTPYDDEKAPDNEKNYLDAIHGTSPANQNQISEGGRPMEIEDEVTTEYFEGEPRATEQSEQRVESEIPPMPEAPAMRSPSEDAEIQAEGHLSSSAPQNLGSTMICDDNVETDYKPVPSVQVEEALPEKPEENSPESAVFTARWVQETNEGKAAFPNGVQNGIAKGGLLPNITPLAEEEKNDEEPSPFTKRWAEKQAQRIPSIIIQTKETPTEEGPKSIPTKEVMKGVKLPSSYRSAPNMETTKITRLPQSNPDAVRGKTRSNLWKWAGGFAVIAGLGAVFAGAVRNSTDAGGQNGVGGVQSSSVLAGSGMAGGEAGPSSATAGNKISDKDSQVSKVENNGEYESGEFRVNSSHPDYQKFVCGPIRSASKLVSTLDEATANSRISYIQDPAAYEQAKEKGIPVLSGKESLSEQRLVIAKVILGNAIAQSGNHIWMRGYFSDMLKSIKELEKTGTWVSGVKAETKQFLEAINADKFVRSAEIVGYAPNADPSSNPGLQKLIKFAPTYGKVVHEIFTRMQSGVDSAPYGNFISIKETVILAIKKEIEKSDGDRRSGLVYMLGKTGTLTCDPIGFNLLDQALTQIMEVKVATTTTKPNTSPSPVEQPKPQPEKNEVAPKTPAPSPTGHNSHERQHNNFNIPTNTVPAHPQDKVQKEISPTRYAQVEKTQKKGFFSRATDKVKSFFGLGNKQDSAKQFASEVAELRRQARGEFTKADIPVKSIGKTISEFFWG